MIPGCASKAETCTPMCTRWTQVNEGDPIKVYHDKTNFDPNFYVNVAAVETDPDVLLQTALDIWEEAYPCGTLFELVDDPSQAELIIQYGTSTQGPGTAWGDATCFCDNDNDVCVQQVDHSVFFTEGNPATINMYYVSDVNGVPLGMSYVFWLETYVHELGHILGMGHVSGLPIDSVMGNQPFHTTPQIWDWDRDQLDDRYPCGCVLTGKLTAFIVPEKKTHTSDFCPRCQINE